MFTDAQKERTVFLERQYDCTHHSRANCFPFIVYTRRCPEMECNVCSSLDILDTDQKKEDHEVSNGNYRLPVVQENVDFSRKIRWQFIDGADDVPQATRS